MVVQGDSGSRLPPPPRSDLWSLPRIAAVAVERVRYLRPRKQIRAGKIFDVGENVEILVRTDGEIPARALSPALFVGGTEVAEGERVDALTYRFFVLDEAQLRPGAPISLGWAGLPRPEEEAAFHYSEPVGLVQRAGIRPRKGPPPEEEKRRRRSIIEKVLRWLASLLSTRRR